MAGRNRRARQAREATLLQFAILAILCGLGIVIYSGAELYADHRYDGGPSDAGVSFCFLDDPPPGIRKCRGVTWADVAPTPAPTKAE
ncbi:hypothetical protein O7626_00610 [Micromonospora sp. WMMD1102]|uniref:hypothetical protein n=1 Tax=Micromonospora sp. WMMD1102 TaxID=3016105 RepID=UPI002414D810|nr:hypothetical protein [Micromonospora sp. WMMD1102]MDG4784448.1 hypothetical protein [Micromonospora sp. WMMD1102]